jgi:hypothetical protein
MAKKLKDVPKARLKQLHKAQRALAKVIGPALHMKKKDAKQVLDEAIAKTNDAAYELGRAEVLFSVARLARENADNLAAQLST